MGLFGFESRKDRRSKHEEVNKLTAENVQLRNDLADATARIERLQSHIEEHPDLTMSEIDDLVEQRTSLEVWLTAAKAEAAALRTTIAMALSQVGEARDLAHDRGQPNMVTWLRKLARTLQGL